MLNLTINDNRLRAYTLLRGGHCELLFNAQKHTASCKSIDTLIRTPKYYGRITIILRNRRVSQMCWQSQRNSINARLICMRSCFCTLKTANSIPSTFEDSTLSVLSTELWPIWLLSIKVIFYFFYSLIPFSEWKMQRHIRAPHSPD